MSNIIERKNKDGTSSYLIRIFVDEKSTGKQTVKSMTYKPDPGLTPKQIEKRLNETAVFFEEKIKKGLVAYDGTIKFEEYATHWMETAQIAPKTRETYGFLLVRINQAIGHLKLANIQPHHIKAFYDNLKEADVNAKGRYAIALPKLNDIIKERKISRDRLAECASMSPATAGAARHGKKVTIDSAKKIATALDVKLETIFMINEVTSGLSDKTILHHHRLISAILATAKRERIIPYNVATEFTTPPRIKKKESRYLDDIEARNLVKLLFEEEDIRIRTSILLALYSGIRRGELCGLSWGDIDEKRSLIHVMRASQYQMEAGIVEVPTKNESSVRAIKLPPIVFQVLTEYRIWWLEERMKNGNRWIGFEERLFIQSDGKPINPDTINFWLDKFIEKHGLERFTPHSLRHTFSTLQLMAGVNIRTLQARTGHAQASTLTNIYAHTIKTADEMASDVLDNILSPKGVREQ